MPASFSVEDPIHWRVRAEEVRTLADEEHDDVAKHIMLRIAADLSKLHFALLAREGDLRTLAASYRHGAQTSLEFARTLPIGEKRTFLIDTAQTLLRLAKNQEASNRASVESP